MGANEFWLVLLILMTIGYFVFRIQEYQKEKTIVTQERANLISKPIPSFVQKSIFDYESGAYGGEDQSPLAYVGYKAGKTANMAELERRQRLEVCFRIDIPPYLPRKYRNWGAPATRLRFERIQMHLNMLAGQRRGRRGYEVAVQHWTIDKAWFLSELGHTAKRFGRYGYGR